MMIVVQNDGRPQPHPTLHRGHAAEGAQCIPNPFRSGNPGQSEPVFDQWLTHHLGRLYDPVVQQPIPAELLRLLELRLK